MTRPTALSFLSVLILAINPAPLTNAQAARTPESPLAFDVVSIREQKPSPDGSYTMSAPGDPNYSLFAVTAFRVKDLIAVAYGVETQNILGGPDWAESARFNVLAKADSSVDDILKKLTSRQASSAKARMLQTVLAERFHLAVHEASKETRIYELQVANGGLKLKLSTPAPPKSADDTSKSDPNDPEFRQNCGYTGCELSGKRMPISLLASILSGQVGSTVADKTGLAGKYDVTLKWRPSSLEEAADGDLPPMIFTAAQQQLGLELKPVRGEAKTIIIDHVDKPTEN